jgi:DUF4097 and DUF4098 domain-containing protein YvlB
VRFAARTVNGAVDARMLQSDADVRTVNGQVTVSTSGVAKASTVNGSLDVSFGSAIWTSPLEFSTVNGSIALRVPPVVDAQVKAQTMNGGFSSDVPLVIQSSEDRGHRITGIIGNGGRELSLKTVNGSIHLQAAR